VKIGLSFFEPVESIDDVHEGDMALNFVVSADEVVDTSQNREP
jgi:hypothetical protein